MGMPCRVQRGSCNMITIIDYGMGNLHSVENALRHIGCACTISHQQEDIRNSDRLILPGVGAFQDCMKNLHARGLVEVLQEEVMVKQKPLLGICLGMQALFEDSEEGGYAKGLGFLKGHIVKMEDSSVRIPHIGWNLLEQKQESSVFSRLSEHPFVYYVHSYYASGYAKEDLLADSGYGSMRVPGLFRKGNIVGAQFHPEKSGEDGLQILRWFKEEVV